MTLEWEEPLDPNEDRNTLSSAVAGNDNEAFDNTAVAAVAVAVAAAVSGGDAGRDVGSDVEPESCWRGYSIGG